MRQTRGFRELLTFRNAVYTRSNYQIEGTATGSGVNSRVVLLGGQSGEHSALVNLDNCDVFTIKTDSKTQPGDDSEAITLTNILSNGVGQQVQCTCGSSIISGKLAQVGQTPHSPIVLSIEDGDKTHWLGWGKVFAIIFGEGEIQFRKAVAEA